MAHRLGLELTREEDVWMARSPAVPGLLVTGETLDQVLSDLNLEDANPSEDYWFSVAAMREDWDAMPEDWIADEANRVGSSGTRRRLTLRI